MPASIQHEADDIYVLRIGGMLLRSEFRKAQEETARDIAAGAQPRILVILEHFDGFEHDADWGDLAFLFSHSNEIARIAIVGEPRWEVDALAFAGAGFRRAPVKFFPSAQLDEARAWVPSQLR